ncbi:hypothetical protein BASA50_004444 [Batrachochytrium salamandrivorans]|uniref:F-box domain-containing protein n=1 Tax=Batrachochytrium salamandrivorans TaxID=1357716 RepID=A0ABQ8FFR1_9FUNG|nr:hypothetical protein BASA61_006073 [Batrachochytrium salamandrivorans]KAH6597527.1 hypothetical protein BASA50_004444 [Batrachochytrium salamandrivorans]KAH9254342.1 hypothetical protein BASA81_007624 [Batrachochytrium salamandrivorans]KAH9265693.1 hypothetical protein BASA83_010981 [Batrachochytrium salamandrivorans]
MGLLDPISLRQILLTSTHLKTLDLGDCTALTSSAFVGLDKMQSKMTHLRLAGCSITDAVVESLLPYWCDSLRSIDLSRCRLLSRHTLLHLASFKLLEIIKINSLNLSQPKDLSMDDAFLILAEGCPLLTSISMRNCPDLTSQCLIYIMQLCDSLHTIHIPGSARVNDAFLSSLLNDLVACRIIDLDISRCPGFTLPAILSLFRELSSLKSLVASGSPCMTDDGVQLLLATADSLEHLDLSLCPNIRGTGLVRGLHGHLRSIPVHCLTLNIASNPQISAETVAYLKQTLGVGRVVSRIGS